MRPTLLLLALMVASCSPPPAPPEPARKPILRVAADPNNLPFSNSRREGFENRIAEIVAEDLGADLEYAWRAQRRGFFRHALKEGEGDVVLGVPVETPQGGDQMFPGAPPATGITPADHVGPAAAEGLGERRVLGVDGDDLTGGGGTRHEAAANDQRLLVGQRQLGACSQAPKGGAEAGRAGDGVQDEVAVHPGELGGGVGAEQEPWELELALGPAAAPRLGVEGLLQFVGCAGPGQRDGLRGELDHLPRQLRDVPTGGGEPDDVELRAPGGDHV